MIRALISSDLLANPIERTGKGGRPYALARVPPPQGDEGRAFCSVIALLHDLTPEALDRVMRLCADATDARRRPWGR